MTNIVKIKEEVSAQLANKEVLNALVATTFKGLSENNVRRAITEGLMRGFLFQDFLEKNVYAIPFKDNYSLVTSIDYARKIGMRSGVVGKSAPAYEEKDGKVISCEITVKRKVVNYVGDYTAKVYMNEYSTGKNLWITKERTMLAKVCEMHALRMACPEELSQSYTEEEIEAEKKDVTISEIKIEEYKEKLLAIKDEKGLKTVWSSLPIQVKKELESVKNELKQKYANPKI